MFKYQDALERYDRLVSAVKDPPDEFWCRTNELYSWIRLGIPSKGRSFSTLGSYFMHSVMGLSSIVTFLRYKRMRVAHYLIDIPNNKDSYDYRSQYVLDALPASTTLNFFHAGNPRHSLKMLFRNDRAVYYESIFFLLSPFFKSEKIVLELNEKLLPKEERKEARKLIALYARVLNESARRVKFLEWLLRNSGVSLFVMIDDSRNTPELLLACQRVGISTTGYMHARFNEYYVGLRYFPFGKYLVWSPYFRDLAVRMTKYDPKSITIVGHPRANALTRKTKRDASVILLIEEPDVPSSEVAPYVSALKDAGFRILFRTRPGKASLPAWAGDLEMVSEGSFVDCLVKNNVSVVIGAYSTALIEAWLAGVPAVMYKSSIDFAKGMHEDDLVLWCDSADKAVDVVKSAVRMSTAEINVYRSRVWGQKPSFDAKKFKSVFLH